MKLISNVGNYIFNEKLNRDRESIWKRRFILNSSIFFNKRYSYNRVAYFFKILFMKHYELKAHLDIVSYILRVLVTYLPMSVTLLALLVTFILLEILIMKYILNLRKGL